MFSPVCLIRYCISDTLPLMSAKDAIETLLQLEHDVWWRKTLKSLEAPLSPFIVQRSARKRARFPGAPSGGLSVLLLKECHWNQIIPPQLTFTIRSKVLCIVSITTVMHKSSFSSRIACSTSMTEDQSIYNKPIINVWFWRFGHVFHVSFRSMFKKPYLIKGEWWDGAFRCNAQADFLSLFWLLDV